MSTPVRDITRGITAHFRVKDRSVYEVVEEIKRAFKRLQAMLDKPTLGGGIPGSPGTDGQAGQGGTTTVDSTHIFDGLRPVQLAEAGTLDERILRAKGTIGDRLIVRQFINGTDQTFEYAPMEQLLTDRTSLTVTPGASVYRGFRQRGSTVVALEVDGETIGPGPNQVVNGGFEGSTYASRTATNPDQWVVADDGTATLVAPGAGGSGFCLQIDVTSGKISSTRSQQANYIVGGSPLGGTNSCVGDASGPGLTNGTLAYFTAVKNHIYTLTFKMRLTGSSASTRHCPVYVFAHPNDSDFGTCGGSSGYSLGGDSASGALSGSFSNWNSARSTFARFLDVPNGTGFQTYTMTIDTSGVGGDVGSTFFVTVGFSGGLTGSGFFQVDDVGWVDPNTVITNPTVIDAPIAIRGISNDEWVISPTVTGDGNSLTFDEITGYYSKPTIAPVTALDTSVRVRRTAGGRYGIAYDGSGADGSQTWDEVASAIFEEPEFGDDPYAIQAEGHVGVLDGKKLKLFGTDGFFTSLRAQDQGVDIELQLPEEPPMEGGVLAAHVDGILYWTDSSGGGSSSGTGYPPQLGYAGI